MGTRCWSFIKGRLFTPLQQLRKTSETFATSSLSKGSSTSKEDMRMFLVVAFLINAGCLASVSADTTPWKEEIGATYTEDNSPTCYKECSEYAELGQCNADWEGCSPRSTKKIKDFCPESCADTTTEAGGTANGKWCGNDGDCASGNCCGGLFGIIGQVCGECCEDRHCDAGWNCYNGLFAGFKCGTAKGNGEDCDQDSDCASGHCVKGFWGDKKCRQCEDDSHCNGARYALETPGRKICDDNACIPPKPNGESCPLFGKNKDVECESGHCCLGTCRECCEDSHCGNGGNCAFLGWYCKDD